MEALGITTIILITLAILPYIAIIGTWNQVGKLNKTVNNIDKNITTAINIIITQNDEMIRLMKGNNNILLNNKSANKTDTEQPTMEEIHL